VIADLRAKLKKAVEEKQEYLLGWQKAKADYINSRKQDEEENRAAVKYAESALLGELVTVLDSFDMAFANEAEVAKLPEQWKKGMLQVKSQLSAILAAHNLEAIDPVGKEFDPRDAEAVGMVPVTDEADDHRVMTVLQKGYRLHGRVLRPAKVQVGKHE
jgi:molecular chaperone GrpE